MGILRAPHLSSSQQELLRWLALSCMVIDHVAFIFLDRETAQPLRALGRIAWPLFAYLLAYNVAVRRVAPAKYLRPLAVFTLLSQLPHWLAFSSNWVNIIGTLLLGATVLHVLEERSYDRLGGLLTLLLVLVLSPFVEYGTSGVLLVAGCWLFLRYPHVLTLSTAVALVALVNYPHASWPFGLLAVAVVIAVTLLPERFGLPRSGRLPWIFYPAHLLVLTVTARIIS